MWLASVTRVLTVITICLVLGQAAFAQGAGKLGTPTAQVPSRPLPDPGTLFAHAGDIGKVLQFAVIGNQSGRIWGDSTYTSDSVLATAAVHAGLLMPGQSGVVSVELMPGLSAYEGVTRNGVASLAYGNWDVAYRLTGVTIADAHMPLPDPGDLSGYRGQNGAVPTFAVTGDSNGSVWGDGVYTDDSALAAAAVHAGVLRPGQSGLVQVEILPGQAHYEGAERNGVSSGIYASWPGSYRVVPLSLKASSKLSNLIAQ